MDALKKNLRQEHVLIHEFLSTFYTQVITCIPRIQADSIHRSFPGAAACQLMKAHHVHDRHDRTARAIPNLSG